MDAIQKQSIRKVAKLHFASTGFVLLLMVLSFLLIIPATQSKVENPNVLLFQIWLSFLFDVLIFLQPAAVLFFLKILPLTANSFFSIYPSWLLAIMISALLVISLLSVPVWSLCFGWIYVKFTNWLNHFPVLGKKVF